MPRWTKYDYESFNARRKASGAKPEPTIRHELLGKAPRKATDGSRFSVCITSFRVKLCDPDNLCAKYFVDCLRYASIIPDDSAAVIDYAIRQEKVSRKEDERTLIEIDVVFSS